MKFRKGIPIAVGTIFNELYRQLLLSFLISFLMKVVELSPSQAGTCVLIAQCVDALSAPLNGYLGDHVKIPFVSIKIGQRKSWHFIGFLLMSVGIPLLFNRCLFCREPGDPLWLPLVYFGFASLVTNVGYGMMEINYLAILTSVSDGIKEATALIALRTLFSFGTGVYFYLVAWGLLGQQRGHDLGPSNLTQIQHLAWISVGTGLLTSIIFYTGTKETGIHRPLARKISTLMDPTNVTGLLQASKSLYSMAFNKPDGTYAKEILSDLITKVEKLDQERKRSLAVRFINSLIQAINHQNQPAEAQIVKMAEFRNQVEESEKEKSDSNKRCQQFDYERYGECKEVNFKSEQSKENKRDNHDVRCRRYGTITPLEEFHENGTGNIEYQEDDADAKTIRSCSQIDSLKTSSTDAVPTVTSSCGSYARPEKEEEFTGVTSAVEPFSEDYMPNLTGPRKKRVSFLQGPLDPKRLQKGKYSEEGNGCVKEHRDVAQEENRVEHVTTHDDIKSLDDLTCHSEASNKNVTIKPKTMSGWLVDPCLYKVSAISTCTRLVQDAVYGYLPLYLTETMGFEAQAMAYFPLVLLCSAALATTVSDKLNNRIGSKWTYILASPLVIGGSVFCFLQGPGLKQLTYAPVVLIGIGLSIMLVMTQAFMADLIQDSMESGGSALSVMIVISRISSGALFRTIQEFYPENDLESNTSRSDYVRYVFSCVPGLLALTGSMLVLFLQPSLICCSRKGSSTNEVVIHMKEASPSVDDKMKMEEK
ncbi:uncharacterized protein [Montipora capricornis]|uniref:uncharacterized protein n=1 Tax=Montipora capricornis TaxID=246305 RepID=UPI0035F1FDE1